MSTAPTCLDNTRLTAFKVCPRSYLLRHVYNWVPEGRRAPLVFGGSWHAAMDVLYREHKLLYGKESRDVINAAYEGFLVKWTSEGMPRPDDMSPDDLEALGARTPMIAKEMLSNYPAARKHLFTDPTFELIDIERPFAVAMDPANPDLYYVGRLDKIVRYRGRYVVIEHKTTSSYRKSAVPFRTDFLDSFSPSAQIDGYLFALRLMYGDQAGGVLVDAALVHKERHDGFTIIPVERQSQMLDAWLWTARSWIDQIEDNLVAYEERKVDGAEYLASFAQNTASCGNYGGCSYLPICKMLARPDEATLPLGYKVEPWDPLDGLDASKLGFAKRADAA